MELIIQEIIQKIISHCEKGLEELIMKKIDWIEKLTSTPMTMKRGT